MDKKEAYKQQMEAKLEQADADLDKLKAKAKEKTAQAKIEAIEAVEEAQSRRDRFKKKLSAVRSTGKDVAEDVQTGVNKAWNDLKTSLDRAKKKVTG